MNNKGCGKKLAKGQWWGFCGETDIGQGHILPVLCTECGGKYILEEQEALCEIYNSIEKKTARDCAEIGDNMDEYTYADEVGDAIRKKYGVER